MLTNEEGTHAVHFARRVVEHTVKQQPLPSSAHLPSVFSNKHGAFVTLHTESNHLLRGCIGIPESIMSLTKAITEAATSVTHDPRFPPLTIPELSKIVVEVTILNPPERITVTNPKQYLNQIKIGAHGLIIEKGYQKGLLLPQVPVEQGWDTETFLAQTCLKAGLIPDSWIDSKTRVKRFSGQIFSEITPKGSVEEKHII